jgi:ceramide glucosyltransferase
MRWFLLWIGLLDRAVRYVAIWRFLRRTPPAPAADPHTLVSMLQPILSGDPTLAASLEANLRAQSNHRREWIWLLDEDDLPGMAICTHLIARFPQENIQLVRVAPAPLDHNPKMSKLICGSALAQGSVIAVLDDDTRLPDGGLDELVAALAAPGAGLAFGLPYYVSFDGCWSALTATFVNSTSLPTYIPACLIGEPTTINGMCYVIRRTVLDRVGGFAGLERIVADDFAIAQRMRANQYRLVQTPVRHAISTQVPSARAYWRLLQRWLIFPRESLMRHLGFADTLRFYAVAVLPLLMPWVAFSALWQRRAGLRLLGIAYVGIHWLGTWWLSRRYLGGAIPLRWAGLIPLVQLALPIQALIAFLAPQRIRWRGHLIRIEPGGTIRIEERRNEAE